MFDSFVFLPLSTRAYFKGTAFIKIILKNHARSYFADRSYYRGNTVLEISKILFWISSPASWSSGNAFVSGAGSEVQILGRSNRTQSCLRLATPTTFLQKKLCCPGAMTRRWASPTRYTLWRITASIMKDLIWISSKLFSFLIWNLFLFICCFQSIFAADAGYVLKFWAKWASCFYEIILL